MRLVLITLEYSSATFSGNGVLAQSQVRALKHFGHNVMVVSARPNGLNGQGKSEETSGLIEVNVGSWGCLDWKGPWKEFATGAGATGVYERVKDFDPRAIIVVDWSSHGVYEGLCQLYCKSGCLPPPLIFFCYRIFSRSNNSKGKAIVRRLEKTCFEEAICSFVLCKSDHDFAKEHLISRITNDMHPIVLHPPLRKDMAVIPYNKGHQDLQESGTHRPYFTCCVRLSEEKEPERFVDIVSEMVKRDLFKKFKLVPMLCAAASTPFAEGIKQQLKKTVPESVVEERFLDSNQLADLFSRTRLNIHPCVYDAFGMTIVEAASQGAPSVVDNTGHVGATTLLKDEQDEIVAVDYSSGLSNVVDTIESHLADGAGLQRIGRNAAAHVRNYTEETNIEFFLKHVLNVLEP